MSADEFLSDERPYGDLLQEVPEGYAVYRIDDYQIHILQKDLAIAALKRISEGGRQSRDMRIARAALKEISYARMNSP